MADKKKGGSGPLDILSIPEFIQGTPRLEEVVEQAWAGSKNLKDMAARLMGILREAGAPENVVKTTTAVLISTYIMKIDYTANIEFLTKAILQNFLEEGHH